MSSNAWYSFLDEIAAATSDLGNPQSVWYRGHSNSHYHLIPTIHRAQGLMAHEQAAFNEFHRTAARLFTPRDNDWETLFDMQHYGLPTRLLDWSKVLGVALAFAGAGLSG